MKNYHKKKQISRTTIIMNIEYIRDQIHTAGDVTDDNEKSLSSG